MLKEGHAVLGRLVVAVAVCVLRVRICTRAPFQVPAICYNCTLIYCNFNYFKFLIIFWLSCSETQTSFNASLSSFKR